MSSWIPWLSSLSSSSSGPFILILILILITVLFLSLLISNPCTLLIHCIISYINVNAIMYSALCLTSLVSWWSWRFMSFIRYCWINFVVVQVQLPERHTSSRSRLYSTGFPRCNVVWINSVPAELRYLDPFFSRASGEKQGASPVSLVVDFVKPSLFTCKPQLLLIWRAHVKKMGLNMTFAPAFLNSAGTEYSKRHYTWETL